VHHELRQTDRHTHTNTHTHTHTHTHSHTHTHTRTHMFTEVSARKQQLVVAQLHGDTDGGENRHEALHDLANARTYPHTG